MVLYLDSSSNGVIHSFTRVIAVWEAMVENEVMQE